MTKWKNIVTLNAGSSSIKFGFFDQDLRLHAQGVAEMISKRQRRIKIKDWNGKLLYENEWMEFEGDFSLHAPSFHKTAIEAIIAWYNKEFPEVEVIAVSHRVVHGGTLYDCPLVITEHVFKELEGLVPLAPLHQPHNLSCVRAAQAAWPGVPQIACFDTAFHRTHEFINDAFAIPREYYRQGIRRYGFHGLSYEFINKRLKESYPALYRGKTIVCHLGNGASMCAISNGKAVASSMGFTAVEGLPMGTRCGNIDPGVILFLIQEKGMTVEQVTDLLYKKSGLRGLSEVSNDMRELEASDDPKAKEAIEYFVARIRGEIGRLAAAMNGLDTIVFTGGIGENSDLIRAKVMGGLSWIRVLPDFEANSRGDTFISDPLSKVTVLIIPTNEEKMLAEHALEILSIE